MSKISEIAKASKSSSFIKLNPEFFKGGLNPSRHKPLIEPEKHATSHPGANKGHSNILSDRFKSTWKLLNGPKLEEEYKFHPERRWRFDFVHLESKVAIEINGGIWMNGRHNRGKGYINDLEKINEAQMLGYKVFQLHSATISAVNIKRLVLFIQKYHLH